MGGLAESSAGYGFTPANPPAPQARPLQCANAAMECRSVAAELYNMKSKLESELQKIEDDRERLVQLEAVLHRREAGGKYDLNMQRIEKLQQIDIIQRNNIFELEKTLSDYKREIADLKNGNTESKALGKLNQIEVLLRQVPHAPMCKVDAGVPCVCHHKAIRAVYDSNSAPAVPSGITAQTIFNV